MADVRSLGRGGRRRGGRVIANVRLFGVVVRARHPAWLRRPQQDDDSASMLDGLADTGNSTRLAGIRSDLQIYLLSGEADPLARTTQR